MQYWSVAVVHLSSWQSAIAVHSEGTDGDAQRKEGDQKTKGNQARHN